MNITRAHVFGFAGLVAFAGALYWAKAEAQAMREQVSVLKEQVDTERRAVRTLEAEAAWLERPDRIEASAKAGLGLAVVAPDRVASLNDLDAVAPVPALALAPAPAAPATPPTPPPAPPTQGATP